LGDFNLLRYFAIASLLVLVALAGAIGTLFARDLERSLVREAGLYEEDLARNLNRAIHEELVEPLRASGKRLELDDPGQRARLDAILARQIEGFRVLTVNLFDRSGTITYSTRPDHIGYRSLGNEGLQRALDGHAFSELARAEFEENPLRPGHDLLETYAPLRDLSPDAVPAGAVIGAIELYQDARPITRQISRGRRRIAATTAGLIGLLFVVLFEIVRRGHVRIQRLRRALEDSNRELERRVEERSAEVVQAESLASLGQMAAGVAHEIRNPVGMISSAAQLLGGREGLPEQDRELVQVIKSESERLNRTISEFVNFAAPTRPSRAPTEPAELLERVRALLRPEAERHRIELTMQSEPGLPRILVDPELLHRALANLVLNAIQVQADGGAVALVAERDGQGVALRVRDRGPGVPPENLEKIFQPFFSTRPGGSGLGLAIVQRIVAQNQGSVAVSSGAAGTTFTLWFPGAP
jgi:signal transduction histidine kinase